MAKIVQIQFSIESGARSAIRLQNAFQAADIGSDIISLQTSSHEMKNVSLPGKKGKAQVQARRETSGCPGKV